MSLLFFYGLTGWVAMVSFTGSQGLLSWDWVGLAQYQRLWADDNWWRALGNLLRYLPIVVGLPMLLGCLLAVMLDQRVRFEGGLRTVYLYPLALILLPAALRTFDLVVVLTQGGPGQSSVLPACYTFDRFFRRDQMGLGAASGSILLMMCVAIAVPYILDELKGQRHD